MVSHLRPDSFQFQPRHRSKARHGAMVILVAVVLPVLLLMAVLAVNVAYMELTRVELRTATDSAVEAAARTLALTQDTNLALQSAQQAASRNEVAGDTIQLTMADLEFGLISRPNPSARFVFTSGVDAPNAVRIEGSRVVDSIGFAFGEVGVYTFEPHQWATAGQTDRDIALVLDKSGSMAMYDDDGDTTGWSAGLPAPAESRWGQCVTACQAFLAAVNTTPMEELVSLVTYSSSATIDEDLTLQYSTILSSINQYTQVFNGGSTNIGDGIEKARLALRSRGYGRAWAEPTIVVMTDGQNTTGAVTPETAASNAAAAGITVHTITYGHDADQTRMQTVASLGNGRHWHAPDSDTLIQVFNQIARSSPTMLVE